jgi:AraC-like DNA-binding protein
MSQGTRLTIRAATLRGFGALCQSLGVSPERLLRQVGLPVDLEAQPDRRMPVDVGSQLLELAAQACGCDDFAIQLAVRRGISNLGPVGVLARDEPTVGAALAVIETHLPIHNDALALSREFHGDIVILRLDVLGNGPRNQSSVLAVAMQLRILRELAGDDWMPEEVGLSRSAPADERRFRLLFGPNLRFNAPFDGLVVRTALLDRPNRLADPAFQRYAARVAGVYAPTASETMGARVRRVLPALIAYRRCTAGHVASQLGVSRRTLTRALADEGETFLAVLDETRGAIAREHLATSTRQLAEIGDLLGFSDPAAFSSWFRRCHGVAPRDWQKANARAAHSIS